MVVNIAGEESVLRLYAQVNLEAGLLQSIDQPVPVERRFDEDTSRFLATAGEKKNLRQIIIEPLLRDPLVFSLVTLTTMVFEYRSIPL